MAYLRGSYGGAFRDPDFRPTMRYYTRDRFPYPQGSGGPYDVEPGVPGLDNPPFQSFPVSQPGAICAAGSTKLNFYRPNQALVRGVVRGGMGADRGPSLLLQIAEIGIGLLTAGLLLGKSNI